jgi:transposase-like protein
VIYCCITVFALAVATCLAVPFVAAHIQEKRRKAIGALEFKNISLHITCADCESKNRIPVLKILDGLRPKCAHCQRSFYIHEWPEEK